MVFETVTRRSFLEVSAGVIATLAASVPHSVAQTDSHNGTSGVVYGRVGRKGIAPASHSASSWGNVVLLDGSVLKAENASDQLIGAGKSVLLTIDEHGGWSILYAEL